MLFAAAKEQYTVRGNRAGDDHAAFARFFFLINTQPRLDHRLILLARRQGEDERVGLSLLVTIGKDEGISDCRLV